MKDMGIDINRIPFGSTIFGDNRIYKVRFGFFWGVIGTLIVLAALSITLIINIYKRKKVEKQIEYMAYHDSLTGINNRQSLLKKMEKLCSPNKNEISDFAVLFIDLDNFKTVNDTVGHDFGDEILIKVAEYIKNIIPEDQFCARLGGDEFVILLMGRENISMVEQYANAILKEISIPVSEGKKKFFIGASIGIALCPKHSSNSKELLKKADLAMYSAKNKGKSRFEVYNDRLEKYVLDRAKLEEDLHNALLHNEFELYYQPKLDLDGCTLIGAEALIIWNHPVRGTVPPDEFIPFAEETGLIVNIGEWVLKAACSYIKEYEKRGIDVGQISINVSPRQFQESDFVETVRRTLKETGAAPRHIAIEITESWAVNDFNNAIKVMNELREMGIDVLLDDFGKGYSSINYLRNLPISMIKIDRSFIKDIGINESALNIVDTIISLAHICHLKVVAEGVENDIQKECLARMGCDEVQGYYYSRPLPGSKFEDFITSYKNSYSVCR